MVIDMRLTEREVREHTKPGHPVPLCNHLVSAEKRLDRSALDTLLAGEAGAAND